jgi:PAS domain S-box-containing protein
MTDPLAMTDPLPQQILTPLIPANETERLAALHRYNILDTPPEVAFDRITVLAARLFNLPIALVSLVDESRAWFKSCIGFDAREVPRDATLCSFAILMDEPLIVPDTRKDDRFACNPFVQSEPGVRFYAGAPLLSRDGFNLGTLCLLDSQPHDSLTAEQQATLVDLAAMVVDELELRFASHQMVQVDAALIEITQGVATATGEAFFEALIQHFARVLDVDYVYIGLVEGRAPQMMRTIATCAQGQIVDNLEYPLQDTPCWEVIEQRKICCYPRNVQAQFPNASLLEPLAVESYVAVPFFDSGGATLGLLGVMDSKPLEHVQLATSLLTLFALRVATELERQQAEAALRLRETQLQMLLDTAPLGVYLIDQDFRIRQVNPIALATFGNIPDLVGRDFDEVIHLVWLPEYADEVVKRFRHTLDTGEPYLVAESIKKRRDRGVIEYYEWQINRIPLPADCYGVVCYFRDISAQVLARQTIAATEERLKSFVEADVVGILFGDVYGGIYEANNELLRIVGYTREDLQAGRLRWTEITPSEYLPMEEQYIAEAQARGACSPYEKEYIRKDGSRVPVLIGYSLLGEAREETVVFILDLSDRKQAEAERERLLKSEQAARESAEQANRIKDEFLAVLSHELRSPLNPILGWSKLLQTGKLDETRKSEALKTIERNAKLQSQLIEDLLDISRIMQGKLILTAAPVSLTFVISAAVETVRLAAEAKNIELQLDLDPTASISGDAARLQQVVWNLLTNAVKFTSNGGQVTVELRQLDQLAQIRVIDTGIGIQPKFLPYVFEYFRQEDGSTTRRFGGLGLGLAIVRQIVELHGGTVQAESLGENQGATFTIQLPVLRRAIPTVPGLAQAQTENTEMPLSNLQILVVDDDDDTREFQAFVLQQSGAKVTAVASGLEALQVLDQFIPDLLVSDIGMAEMDGYMLIQQIRSRPATQGGTISAIALTAYAREFDQQKALQAGFQDHLTKPVELEGLVKAIVRLLQKNRPTELVE